MRKLIRSSLRPISTHTFSILLLGLSHMIHNCTLFFWQVVPLGDLKAVSTKGGGSCLIYSIFHTVILDQNAAWTKRHEFAELLLTGPAALPHRRLWDYALLNPTTKEWGWTQVCSVFPTSSVWYVCQVSGRCCLVVISITLVACPCMHVMLVAGHI